MSYDTDEKSIAGSRPVELYEFTAGSLVYRYTSAADAISYGGHSYTPAPLQSSSLGAPGTSDPPEFSIEAPYDLPFVVEQGTDMPAQGMTLLLSLYQRVSGVALGVWFARVTSIALTGNTARIRVPSVLDDALDAPVPSKRYQLQCMHQLFDARCTLSPLIGFTSTTIAGTTSNPRIFTVAGVGGNPDDWYTSGQLLDVATGERRMIVSQVGTTIEIKDRLPIANLLSPVRTVYLYAGCRRTVEVCSAKWNNVKHFTGFPYIPSENMFTGGLRGL
jgi:hypothetical protein